MSKEVDHVFIIAEAGVNHNGNLDLALQLCDAAKKVGVDAIKFQTWKTENIVTHTTSLADYQISNNGPKADTQFEMLKSLELKYEDFLKIRNYCNSINLPFLSTPDDEESLLFLISLGLETIKVGSGEITNIPFLRKVGEQQKNVILSTGMCYLADVEKAYRTLLAAGAKSITLLHCTTNYPCPVEEVNLNAMLTLKAAFKCKVGYSDHTEGIDIPIAAVALGAQIIEKHFTLNKSMEGPDHKASLNPSELMAMVKAIRNVEKALGNGIKEPNRSEQIIQKVVRKKIVACKYIVKGEIFSDKNITVKRCDNGISAEFWDLVCGRISDSYFDIDQPITF
jgi:N,N'-diacetyllegionaminate synthase